MESSLRDQPDLRSLLQTLWRRKWLFAGIVLTIPIAVYVISTQVTKTFEASALVSLESTPTDVASLQSPSLADIESESLLLNTEKVGAEAAETLGGGESAAGVAAAVDAEPLRTQNGAATNLLLLTAQAETGERAADLANAYARAIDTVRTEKALRQLDATILELEDDARRTEDDATEAELARQLQLLSSARDGAERDTQVVQEAAPPSSPISPHPRRNTALAAVVALLLALGAVALAERLDRRLRDSNELEPLLGAPLLSVIPSGAFPGEKPAHVPVKEAFRTLAASLVYFNAERPVSTVIVSSPTKGDGKTTVAVHLAVALARDGKRTILVDCDLRHPQVAVRLGIEPAAGVVDVLTEQSYLADSLVDVDVGAGKLQVLASGSPSPNPARLLGSQRMDSLLEKLSKRADIVIVDTPPILNVSDAIPLLEQVSGTVVVAKVGATSKDALLRLRQVIETSRGTILGAAATGSAVAGLYGYGSEYYGGDDDAVDLESPLPEPQPAREVERPGAAESDGEKTPEVVHSPPEDIPPEAETQKPTEAWRPPKAGIPRPPNGSHDAGELPKRPAPPSPGPAATPPPSGQLPPVVPKSADEAVSKPAPIIEQPTQEWDAAEGWGAAERWDAPDPWSSPETPDDSTSGNSPDRD